MRDAECPFNLEMQDDKTVQKLAAVIKKELANRTETFGEIFKYAKQKGISFTYFEKLGILNRSAYFFKSAFLWVNCK